MLAWIHNPYARAPRSSDICVDNSFRLEAEYGTCIVSQAFPMATPGVDHHCYCKTCSAKIEQPNLNSNTVLEKHIVITKLGVR